MRLNVLFYTLSLTTALVASRVIEAKAQHAAWKDASYPGNIRALPDGKYRTVLFDLPQLRQELKNAGDAATPVGTVLPMPDGSAPEFLLHRSEVLTPALARQHPEIQTYAGKRTADGAVIHLTVSDLGVSAIILDPEGTVYLNPAGITQPDHVLSYRIKDYTAPSVGIYCGTQNTAIMEGLQKGGAGHVPLFGDCQLRTYVISVAATGEYTSWAGGQSQALAAITTTINNINAIYERDLSVHFTLNSPNDILYADSLTDPYSTTGSPTGATLNQNQSAIDAEVTSGAYDLGHVFNAGWSGGLAQLSSVCDVSKARAASGLDPDVFPSGPSGPIFDGTVAHEIGHQFSATHTMAANNGGCSGNVTGSSAWEPGGGSTIMAYAGTCSGNAYQGNSDLYFHSGNIAQMATFMLTTTCADVTPSGNGNPAASVSAASYAIPNNTPFRLTLNATDPDGDALTYTWEQLNAYGGTGTSAPPSATATFGPNFRSFPPSSSGTRYFPSISALLSGSTTYEKLPTVARSMTFRGLVRDNNSGSGCTDHEDVTVSTQACGPFSITSHSSTGTFTADGSTTTTLTWNTASACVTCANINIRFSTDGGNTYPFLILGNTANDGTETFTVPNLPTCDGRFLIECADNIFFNINAAAQTITSSCAANGATISPATALQVTTPGDAALNMSIAPQYGTAYANPIAGSIAASDPAGSLAVFSSVSSGCINFGGNPTHYDTYVFTPSVSGAYTFNAAGSTFGLVYNLYNTSYSPGSPCTNFIASSATYNGSSVSFGSNTVSATLCAQKTYVLLVSSFNASVPTLPASYSVAVSGPGTLYNGTPQPAGFNYSYVIVNNSTGLIKEVRSTPDMTNAGTYPAGDYSVYGISSSSTAASLNTTYANGLFSVLYNATLNQTGGLCASLSTNFRNVQISIPTTVQLLVFDARWEKDQTEALVSWNAAREQEMNPYEIQRSYDGSTFTGIAVQQARNQAGTSSYSFTDRNIGLQATDVFYRLKMTKKTGGISYSGAAHLKRSSQGTNSVRIVPNPLQGDLNAILNLAKRGHYRLSVVNMLGQTLQEELLELQAGTQAYHMSAELPAGVYIFRLQGNGQTINTQFVKTN